MTDRDIIADTLPSKERLTEGRNIIAVVGINRYRAWPFLDNAVNDAKGILGIFQKLGFEQIVAPLIDEAATADAMRHLIHDDLAVLSNDDNLVLFFAGHGHTETRMLQSGPVQTGYLIPVDGARPEGRTGSWLRLDTWLSDVARLPARHVLVILDACHSGIALGSLIKWRGGAWPSDSLDELRRRQSRRVITSALADQRAMDCGPIGGHSLFTGCLIEGLTGGLARDGRREATGSELGVYVQQYVTRYSNARQTPDFGTLELDNRGELILPIVTAAQPAKYPDRVAVRMLTTPSGSTTAVKTRPKAGRVVWFTGIASLLAAGVIAIIMATGGNPATPTAGPVPTAAPPPPPALSVQPGLSPEHAQPERPTSPSAPASPELFPQHALDKGHTAPNETAMAVMPQPKATPVANHPKRSPTPANATPRVDRAAASRSAQPRNVSSSSLPEPPDPPSPPPRELRARIDDVDVTGSLPRGEVARAVDRQWPAISHCVPKSPVNVVARFTIGDSRRAQDVRTTGPNPALNACVTAALGEVRTEVAPDVGDVEITVRIAFVVKT